MSKCSTCGEDRFYERIRGECIKCGGELCDECVNKNYEMCEGCLGNLIRQIKEYTKEAEVEKEEEAVKAIRELLKFINVGNTIMYNGNYYMNYFDVTVIKEKIEKELEKL